MKIFLPNSIFYSKKNCDLYGDIVYDHDKKTEAFYIVESAGTKLDKGDVINNKFRYVGQVLSEDVPRKRTRSGSLCFRYDRQKPNIYLDHERNAHFSNANIFLYNPKELLGIAGTIKSPHDDISNLNRLLQDLNKNECKTEAFGLLMHTALNLPLQLMTRIFILFMESKLAYPLLYTSFYDHYKEWRKFNSSGNRKWNIVLDKILGIALMIVLLFYVQEPGKYVLEASYLVIDKLRLLLRSLKGSPIGLKLNVHLNNFFLDCFNYHIDLWATFLQIIEPSIQQLFVPITLFGSMGLSCQLALLADLLSIVSLHAHCFYIYAAVLYKVEIRGLGVLWNVVRGKRFNLLKKRTESHNYTNRQLYLATIFFTTLLFLFPTILVYYVVFTSLRLCTYSIIWLLKTLRRRILEFPLQNLYDWSRGKSKDRDSIQIKHICSTPPPSLTQNERFSKMPMSVFEINVQSSTLGHVLSSKSGVLQKLTTHEDTTLKNIFKRILKGEFQ